MRRHTRTHQLDAAETSHSQSDWVSLIAALLVQHRHQVLEPQCGTGTEAKTHTFIYYIAPRRQVLFHTMSLSSC